MYSQNKQRFFLSVFFFLSGFCFSTWTSRIPTIKAFFNYSDAELGSILLCMPLSSLIGLPISGWLVSRFDSRKPLIVGIILLSTSLILIGFANSTFMLIVAISLFAFNMRILNIAINSQAIVLQKKFNRRINGSFHGLWSTGGIAGVGFSTLLVALKTEMIIHVSIVAAIAIIATIISSRFLLRNDLASSGNKIIIGKPDPYILYLGLLVFFAAFCEGGMFDWSGVYFKEVVHEDIFTFGYLIFMVFMALSRFISDKIIEKIGMPGTYFLSASLIFIGILIAVLFPSFWTSMIGFCFVGFGTAPIIPMTFTLAGISQKYSPGIVISIITTYTIAGMFIGPPLVGYLSQAFGLRYAFIVFALSGLAIIPISQMFFLRYKSETL